MNLFITFFISYFLTYLGFFLGKVTKYEHEEVESKTKLIIKGIILIFYSYLMFLFEPDLVMILLPLLVIYIFASIKKIDTIIYIHNILLYSLVYFYYSFNISQKFFLILIPLFVLFLENSFIKFNLKREIFGTCMLIFISIFYYFGF